MRHSEAGRRGGLTTASRYGVARCPTCGCLHDSGYMQALGSRGGRVGGMTTKFRYGIDHYREIGRLGGRPRRQAPPGQGAVDNGEGAAHLPPSPGRTE